MSKAIVIKKNGVSQNLTVDKLRTNGADGQSIDWVPEDTVQLVALNATANGTYTPTGGAYGFEYATVSVPGSVVTGKKPDGNTYVYTKDGSGALVETKVPSEIRITTMPTNVGPYGQGAYLDFSGIVVKAYYADGTEYGEIPYNDLVFPVTVAQYDPDAPALGGVATSDLVTSPVTMPIPFFDGYVKCDDDGGTNLYAQTFEYFLPGAKLSLGDRYGNGKWPIEIWASKTENTSCIRKITYKHDDTWNEYSVDMDRSYTYNGLTVYYYSTQWSGGFSYNIFANTDSTRLMNGGAGLSSLSTSVIERIAWTLIYGSSTPSGGTSIPVQWQRPGDGLVLETAFGISVVPGPSGNDN